MQRRTLPSAPGLSVSALGFGARHLPLLEGDPARVDEAAVARLLHQAIEAGVDYVDTGWSFQRGEGEAVMGRALGGGWRERVRLAVKLPLGQVERPGDWERLLEARLERLATGRADFCLLDGLTLERWALVRRLGGLAALERARADGRIGRLGFTFGGTPEALDALLAAHSWDLCQLSLDVLDPAGAGRRLLGRAAARGVGVVVAEPLRGGLVARPPPVLREAWAAAGPSWSPAEWALRWAWDGPGVVTVLCGTASPEHLRENLRVAGGAAPLSAGEHARVEAVRRSARARRRVACTSCGGCTVCARQLPVPDLFSLYNDAMFDSREAAAEEYRTAFLAAGRGADQCIACRVCEPFCGGKLPIPERLEEAHAYLTGA